MNGNLLVGGLVLLVWATANLGLLFGFAVPGLNESIVTRILGMLDAAALAVVYFYFGSSSGSRSKDQIIAAKETSTNA
jgi:hypothetical protein